MGVGHRHPRGNLAPHESPVVMDAVEAFILTKTEHPEHPTHPTHTEMSNHMDNEAINQVNAILDVTVPMELSMKTQSILMGEPYTVNSLYADDVQGAINELLRLKAIDARTIKAITEAREAQTADLQSERLKLVNLRRAVDKDFQKISEMLGEAADDNNICEIYEETLDKLNRELTTGEIAGREREFTVTVVMNVAITARNEDDARDAFKDDPEAYCDFDCADITVEED
jgi:hypothetical protein